MIGTEVNCLAIGKNFIVGLVPFSVRQAHRILDIGIVRVEPQRLFISIDGILILGQTRICMAHVHIRLRPIRTEPDYLARGPQCFVVTAEHAVAVTRLIPRFGIVRISVDCPFKKR